MKSDPIAVLLSRPIQAHGEEVSTLAMREPTGKDLRTMGLPFSFTAGGDTQVDTQAMARAISTLCAVPSSSVDQLSARDFLAASMVVMGFFAEAPTAGTGPTKS